MNTHIIPEIRRTLRDSADEKTLASGKHFFKEQVTMYGVKVPEAVKIGRLAFDKIKQLPKAEVFALCEELWSSGYNEEAFIAANWSYYLHKKYEPSDFAIFERWVGNYVSNWATCDTLCNHTVGEFLEMYPVYVAELKRWANSDNRWMKRAAAVSLIIPARKGLFLDDVLDIAGTLLVDPDDLVQKGYGWMLKAASMTESFVATGNADPEFVREHRDAVFDFIIKHRSAMPRTALRYAIEKMPPEMRAEAMRRGAASITKKPLPTLCE